MSSEILNHWREFTSMLMYISRLGWAVDATPANQMDGYILCMYFTYLLPFSSPLHPSILFSLPSPDSSNYHPRDCYLLSCSGLRRSFSAMPGPNPFRRSKSAEGGDGLPPTSRDAIKPTALRTTSVPGLQGVYLHPILFRYPRGP